MAETMEQYMSKTRVDYRSGVARPKIKDKDNFELKGKFLKELRTNTFSGSDHEDANEHIKKVLEIVDLFHIPNITIDQVMLRAFPMSLTGAVSRWLRNEPTGLITTWDGLKTKILNKYCPHARTTKKMEEINNFQQEPDENLYQAWGRFKELLMKCPQHYLTKMQEVILFYNGLGIPTRQILDSRGAIPSKTAADAKIKKVNEKVYTAQVRCEQCKGPHYTKDCPLKEEGKTIKEAYYTQFGGPFQGGGYIAAAPGYYQRTVKYRKGIAENVLVGIGKFVFPVDFIILDMPEDIKVPLILRRLFLSTARAKIDVFKRKITLREEYKGGCFDAPPLRKVRWSIQILGGDVMEEWRKPWQKYMSKTQADYRSRVARPKIEDKDNFKLKGQFLKELRTNTFSSSYHEDAKITLIKVLEIDRSITFSKYYSRTQVMLREFPMSLTRAASRWLRNEPTGSITTWDGLKTNFLNKYYPPSRTAKKMEEINNFQQEPNENLYQAWERFKDS
ncbi:reverse transcriptase domain-containing protein [Tanacetum coccineum]